VISRRGVLASVLLAASASDDAASGPKRVGFLSPYTRAESQPFRDVFVDEMRVLGWLEGKDYIIVDRFADGRNERLPDLASQLVALQVDLLFVSTTNVATAARQATAAIPIVFYSVGDPVKAGFADSLQHPGHNMTGLTNLSVDLGAKRLELLKQMVPRLERLAVLANPTNPYYATQLSRSRPAADRLGLALMLASAHSTAELEAAFQAMARDRMQAVSVTADVDFFRLSREIAQLASRYRIPSIFPFTAGPEAGGLMSYGDDVDDAVRRVAAYADRIFKGAKPGDLPIEQPTKVELVINGATAKSFGLVIPAALRLQAERVID
jgi:putative ABC transport system substrate-binding protein